MKRLIKMYPMQYWALMLGTLIYVVGNSFVWPYLNIYIQEKLSIPLRYGTLIVSVRAVSSILFSLVAGSFADKFGRRFLILSSLVMGVAYFLGMQFANKVWEFILLMILYGALDICCPVGVSSMIADIIPEEERLNAYSIHRVVNNVAYASGPVIGGLLASKSYSRIFYGAGILNGIAFLLLVKTLNETLPNEVRKKASADQNNAFDFSVVLKDTAYVGAVAWETVILIGAAAVFNLLSFYAVDQFGITEDRISFVYTTNALMCVFIQIPVINAAKRIKPFKLLTLSGLLYGIGICGFAAFPSVPWYCLCIAVMTLGELLATPTLSGLAAKLAPEDARGRYMSLLNLTTPVGQNVGLVLLGYCYDMMSPKIMWLTAGFFPLLASYFYKQMDKKYGNSKRLDL